MSRHQANTDGRSKSNPSQNRALVNTVWILIVVGILTGAVVTHRLTNRPETSVITVRPSEGSIREQGPKKLSSPATEPSSAMSDRYQSTAVTAPMAQAPTVVDDAKETESLEILIELLELKPADGVFSSAQINEINKLLAELKQQGAFALSAVQEYLESMNDIDFSMAVNPKLANYATLRVGLIDVLGQIPGSEAKRVLLQTLAVAATPKEIAMLARSLDRHADNEHSAEILDTALDTLDHMLESETNEEDEDVSFLFAVLERYGDIGLAQAMEDAYPRWNSYSTMTLATLADGAGIPVLARLAEQNPETGRDKGSALQMLVQATREHPDAVEALVQLAGSGKVTSAGWRRIAKTLGGEEYRFRSELFEASSGSGTQMGKPSSVITGLYVQAHQRWSSNDINRRIELIDQLSRIAPLDVAEAFERARSRLSSWRESRPAAGGVGVTR